MHGFRRAQQPSRQECGNFVDTYGGAIGRLKSVLVNVFERFEVGTYFDIAMCPVLEHEVAIVRHYPIVRHDSPTRQRRGVLATTTVFGVPVRHNNSSRTRLFWIEALAIAHAPMVITTATDRIVFVTSNMQHVLCHQLKQLGIRQWVRQLSGRNIVNMAR